jgi:lysophospholipase L1-like esterase
MIGLFQSTRAIILIILLLLLFGCGGGGGSNSENSSLKADAGPDSDVEEATLVTLDGTGSTGSISSYRWDQVGGPVVSLDDADSSTANYTAPVVTAPTVLRFRLSVSDNNGANSSDEVENAVIPVNEPPTADAGPDQFAPGQTAVTLDGSQSSDSDGTIVSYTWSQIDGPAVNLNNTNTATPSFTAPAATDLLTFELTVTDNEEGTASDKVTVSVAKILFSDDFSDGVANGWVEVPDSGHAPDWREVNLAYFQENTVAAKPGGFDESYLIGTYSYLAAGVGSNDYRFSVQVTPLPNSSGSEGNDVGVMFRFVNNDYYRLSINSRYGFTRLEKIINGIFTPLAVNANGYYESEPLDITIDINGSLIQVFLDDEPIFGVTDSDIFSGTIALYCQDGVKFDNVIVTESSPAPAIIISEPVAYSIATTDSSIDSDTLVVSAIVTNPPEGGWVDFVLDDTHVISSVFPPHTVQFFNVAQGEHKVDSILRDSSGLELGRDTNLQIGASGDYYLAIGDSITNGIADDNPLDNASQDGRIIGIQGYEANLNDLLTSTLNYPHIVFNEGIGGDASADMLGRIDSIIDRYPVANKVLILFGTIDSGRGVTDTAFRNAMQSLVNTVVSNGMEAWVALIPPVFNSNGTPDTTRNQIIQQYNNVISNQLNNIQIGPDFFSFFLDKFDTHYADSLHPNGLGYAAMANEWHDVLVQ